MKLIKTLVVGMLLAGTMGVIVTYIPVDEEVVINQPLISATSTDPVVEEDVLEKANRELERISRELDEEEARLLQEIADREARLEQIRQTRTSF